MRSEEAIHKIEFLMRLITRFPYTGGNTDYGTTATNFLLKHLFSRDGNKNGRSVL